MTKLKRYRPNLRERFYLWAWITWYFYKRLRRMMG